MKILHISDLHLGVKLSSFSPDAIKKIRLSVESGMKRIRESLASGEYDGLILAGDIFESRDVSAYNLRFIESCIEGVLNSGGFAIYATGNHDYWVQDSDFTSFVENERFILFTNDRVEKREFLYGGKKVAVYGIGYRTIQPSRVVGSDFPERGDEDIAIGVLHGEVSDGITPPNTPYYNAGSSILQNKFYDYFALGHIHKHKDFGKGIVYPGCTFPQGYDELGEKFALDVEISDKGPLSIQERVFTKHRVFDISLELSPENRGDLAFKLKTEVENILDSIDTDPIFRLRVSLDKPVVPNGKADMEMMEYIFGISEAGVHRLDFVVKPKDRSESCIPEELKYALSQAVEGFKVAYSDGSLKMRSAFDSPVSLVEILEKYDLENAILDRLEGQNVD